MVSPRARGVLRRGLSGAVVALVVLVVLSGAGTGPVGTAEAAPTNVTGCTTIDSPGVYELNTSITDSTRASCINVTASDVVLDGNGNTVDGVDTSGTVGLDVSNGSTTPTNVTVRNLTLTDWGNGTEVDGVGGAPGVTLTNLTVVSGGVGISVTRTANVTVNGSAARIANNTGDGIALTNTTDARLADLRVTGNDGTGIDVEGSANVTVEGVASTDNQAGAGFVGTGLVRVLNSTLSNNGVSGTVVTDASGAVVRNNTVENNSVLGIGTSNVTDATVADNRVDGRAETTVGVSINLESAGVVVRNNTVGSADRDGILLFRVDGPVTVRNNTVTGNDRRGVFATGASNVTIEGAGTRVADNGGEGINLTNTTDVRVKNVTAGGNGEAAVVLRSLPAPSTVRVRDLELRSAATNATVSFEGDDIAVRPAGSPPTPPVGEDDIGQLLNATGTSAGAFLNVTVEYDEADVRTVEESTLDLWSYDRPSDTWTELGGTLDAAANEISYNVTSFSVLAPLSELTRATVVDGGSPEDLSIGESAQNVTNVRVEGITDSTIKMYYNVTPLADRNVNLGSLSVRNFTATNGTADQTNVNSNSGVTVVELTVTNISASATNVSFELAQLGTGSATNDTRVTYAVNVSEGTTSDSRFDGSSGAAPDANDPQSSPFAIGSGSGQANSRVDIVATNSPVPSGGTVEVTARVNNTGPAAGSDTVELRIDGVVEDTAPVSLASGENATVELLWPTSLSDVGTFTATVATSDDSASTPVRSVAFFGISPRQDGCTGDASGGDNPNDKGENDGCRDPR